MSRSTPQMRRFAKRLITYEASRDKTSETNDPKLFSVYEKLQPLLATLIGNGGFRALISRSLVLAKAEVPWMQSIRVKLDGSLESVKNLHEQIDADEFFEGRIILLSHLLGLLVAFIGENLTFRLVRDIWPMVSLNNLDLDNKGKHEKSK